MLSLDLEIEEFSSQSLRNYVDSDGLATNQLETGHVRQKILNSVNFTVSKVSKFLIM